MGILGGLFKLWVFSSLLPGSTSSTSKPKTFYRGRVLAQRQFNGEHFEGYDFSGADLRFARFNGAYLNGAIFDGARLYQTDFSGADLTNADFSKAQFDSSPNLAGAKLDGTRFPPNFSLKKDSENK